MHPCLAHAIVACGLWDGPELGHAQLRKPMAVYVNYRDGGIYWTNRKLLLPARENVRYEPEGAMRLYRCGNYTSRVPMQPQAPNAQERPILEELGLPEAWVSQPEAFIPAERNAYVETVGTAPGGLLVLGNPGSRDGGTMPRFAGTPLVWAGAAGGIVAGLPLREVVGNGITGGVGATGVETVAPEPATTGYLILACAVVFCWRAVKFMRRMSK